MAQKIAIITGASSGLGREFARQLDGDSEISEMWLIARREERLTALAKELATPSRVLAGSVTDPDWQEDLRQRLAGGAYEVRILINSAGFGKRDTVEAIGEEVNAEMVELNCESLTRICSICLPYLTKGSRILNIASVAGFLPQPKFAVYGATKAYVISYSRALHAELKKRGITVTAVCPNPMETEFFDVAGSKASSIKKLGVEPVDGVAAKALRRSAKGKDLSVYSFVAKAIRVASRLLPHRFIIFMEQKLGI